MGSRRLVLTALVSVSMLVGGIAGPAQANFSGATGNTGCAGVNMPDNKAHTWYNSALTTSANSAMMWLEDYVNGNTVMVMSKVGTLGTTDQIMRDDEYRTVCGLDWYRPGHSGVVGLFQCDFLNGIDECAQSTIRLSEDYIGDVGTTAERALVLHETGHAFGLTHYNVANEIMHEALPASINYFSAHDKAHLSSN